MSKRNKIIISSSLIIPILPLTFSMASCIRTEKNLIKAPMPKGFEFVPYSVNKKQVITDKLINNILEKQFKLDEASKVNFLNSQKNEEALFNEFYQLTEMYISSGGKSENLENLNIFYSKNWLFVLKNITQFEWRHIDYWSFEPKEKTKHSDEFIEKIKWMEHPRKQIFLDNYFDELYEGEESRESNQDVFYLKKGKMVIRILISRNNGVSQLTFDKIIHFTKARSNKISIRLISSAVHNGIIHEQQAGYDVFEKDIITNFGYPSLGVLLVKEKNETN
ncbi:hypothetical protein JS510_01005 [Mycoplasma tauri]|uniref:aromatic motif membrane protein n=1 Tax=Mycoplasma tauri TaxID=547987 RepID=UPI001967A91D|nr:aromatic motif membrane protein [Mycoplasma tauri]QSB07685.1 hypothetical protein JS510_01005 [Mycoplasma tauri]